MFSVLMAYVERPLLMMSYSVLILTHPWRCVTLNLTTTNEYEPLRPVFHDHGPKHPSHNNDHTLHGSYPHAHGDQEEGVSDCESASAVQRKAGEKKKKNSNCEPDSDEEPIKYILYGGTFFPFGT